MMKYKNKYKNPDFNQRDRLATEIVDTLFSYGTDYARGYVHSIDSGD